MKTLLILITVLFSYFIEQEKPKLNGVYRIEFDKKYAQQGFQMTFTDSVYKKRMPDAVTSTGKIKYEKFRAILQQNKESNSIEIDNREINKDTMKFTTKSYIDISKTINSGKMIKVK